MKKIYATPLVNTVRIDVTHHLLDASQTEATLQNVVATKKENSDEYNTLSRSLGSFFDDEE